MTPINMANKRRKCYNIKHSFFIWSFKNNPTKVPKAIAKLHFITKLNPTIVNIPLNFLTAPQQPRKDTRIQTMAAMMSNHGNDKCT